MSGIGFPEILVIALIIALVGIAFKIVPYWFIFRKAGYHPALSLLMVVPIASIIMLFFLAFAEWPILKKSGGQTS